MEQSEDELEVKQSYLRSQIIDKGYDPNEFSEALMKIKGENAMDLENWSFEELSKVVNEFQLSHGQQLENLNDQIKYNNENMNQGESNDNSSNNKEEVNNNGQNKDNQGKDIKGDEEDAPTSNKKPDSQDYVVLDKLKEISIEEFYGYNKDNFVKIECKKQTISDIADNDNMEIEIKDPELVNPGFFSKNYYQFTIECKDLQTKAVRKFNDFVWFKERLATIYPAVYLPPFPKVPTFGGNSKEELDERVIGLNRFIEGVSKNPLIRSGKLFLSFIITPQNEFEKLKNQYTPLKSPTEMKDFITQSGELNIQLDMERDKEVANIYEDINNKKYLYNNLLTSIRNLIYEFGVISQKLNDVSIAFKNLSLNYKTSINGKTIQKAYDAMSNTILDWSKSYDPQIKFFQEEYVEFFRYMRNEILEFYPLFDQFYDSRCQFADYTKIDKIKNDKKKIEANRKGFVKTRVWYGFILNRLYDEYSRINELQAIRIKKHFTLMNDKKVDILNDFNNLLQLFNTLKINE